MIEFYTYIRVQDFIFTLCVVCPRRRYVTVRFFCETFSAIAVRESSWLLSSLTLETFVLAKLRVVPFFRRYLDRRNVQQEIGDVSRDW